MWVCQSQASQGSLQFEFKAPKIFEEHETLTSAAWLQLLHDELPQVFNSVD